MEKTNVASAKTPVAPPPGAKPPAPLAPAGPLPPLFRRTDWLTMLIATVVVFIGYFWTLAPEQTLEDSGELAVASLYAGIPHPPGYPLWTIYTYFWALLPFGNVAWRVALGGAFSGALACGVLAMMVSRGSSMFMESIAAFKDIDRRWENRICVVSGIVAGMLLGFNGFMWSQSVIVEVYAFSVLSLMGTLCFLMRWVYAPHQRRYLYLSFFVFGICFTNHQSLLLGAMGLEVAIIAADRRIGRDLLMGNTILYAAGFFATKLGATKLNNDEALWLIFNAVGLASTAGFFWLTLITRKTRKDWMALVHDLLLLGCLAYVGLLLALSLEFLAPGMISPGKLKVIHLMGWALLGGCAWLVWEDSKRESKTLRNLFVPVFAVSLLFVLCLGIMSGGRLYSLKADLGTLRLFLFPGLVLLSALFWFLGRKAEIRVALTLGVMWFLGAAFYFYMPIAGMSCPPMQWGYPRTREGFIHALTRGQYESSHPSNVLSDPLKFLDQLLIIIDGVNAEFNAVYALIALVPFLFLLRMQKRERAWLIGLGAVYLFLAVLMVIMLNPTRDRQTIELTRVFFTASHAVWAMFIGYGVTMLMASALMSRDAVLRWLPLATLILSAAALDTLVTPLFKTYGTGLVADGIKALAFGIVCLASVFFLWRRYQPGKAGIPIAAFFVAAFGLYNFFWAGIRQMVQKKADLFESINVVINGLFIKLRYGDPTLTVYGAVLAVGIVAAGLTLLWIGRHKLRLGWLLGIMALMPFYSVLSNWADNEQRNHWFGYWFGHDMFTPPFEGPDGKLSYDAKLREQVAKGPNGALVYPEMTRDTILFGGTDPGRFCPTYMIFCDSFMPTNCQPDQDKFFDRRDVYLITQNALADGTYLMYLRSQYHRSAQKARQLDTPFFQELLRGTEERKENRRTNYLAQLFLPLDKMFTRIGERIEEKRRTSTSYFKREDFLDAKGLAARFAQPQTALDRQLAAELSPETKQLLSGGDSNALRDALAADLNRVLARGIYDDKPLAEIVNRRWEATFELETLSNDLQIALQRQLSALAAQLQARAAQLRQTLHQCESDLTAQLATVEQSFATNGVTLSPHLKAFIRQVPQSFTRIRLTRQLLEAAYPKEIAVSPGGVYPDREIYIPSPEDLQVAFSEYTSDAARRKKHDLDFPNEPRQVRGGENINISPDGRVQVSGQVAVMNINGLLTKVIFDQNPTHDFYVEESFPLDWMFPHLTPYGIIMKINREPLAELSEEIVKRDHEFWSKYSERLIGNWITYDTPVKEITAFAEKTYLRHDFSGFKGDRKFVRDDQAQKAFSKLRSSIAGIYAWRLGITQGAPVPPQYLAKGAERERMIREADFALKQAVAFCPYSPEAVMRYIQVLALQQKLDDALLVAETCLKLDPYNTMFKSLVEQLKDRSDPLAQMEADARANPTDFQKGLNFAGACLQMQTPDRALPVLEAIQNHPQANVNVLVAVAQVYSAMNKQPQLERVLERLTRMAPDQPEFWYHYAAAKLAANKRSEALEYLKRALDVNARLRIQHPTMYDLRTNLPTDPRFAPLRDTAEYKALVAPK